MKLQIAEMHSSGSILIRDTSNPDPMRCAIVAKVNSQEDAKMIVDAVNAVGGIPLVRYCPECGHVGEVPDTARNCCPDAHPAYVPETFVQVMERSQVKLSQMFHGKDALLAEAAQRATQVEARCKKLEGLILKALDCWWPFVHGATGASNTAKNLRQELSDGVQPELPRWVTVHDHFDTPMDPDSEDGKDTIAKMNRYIETGELSK